MDRFGGALQLDQDIIEASRTGTAASTASASAATFGTIPLTPKTPNSASAIAAATAALSSAQFSAMQRPENAQVKLEQMLEAQMIAEILRANANLKQFKAFRVNSERQYQERAEAEREKAELLAPLEAAQTEIEILNGKVERRDQMIAQLRRQVKLS